MSKNTIALTNEEKVSEKGKYEYNIISCVVGIIVRLGVLAIRRLMHHWRINT